MTQATGDHASSFAANSVGYAIQAERIKIADWLKEEAKIHKASGSRELWQVVYLYSTYVRDGTYAHPTQEPHP